MNVNVTLDRLRDLAKNLYWAWHPDILRVFRDLDPQLWRIVNHNPTEFLSRLADQVVQEKAAELAIECRLTKAFHHLQSYLQAERVWGAWHAGVLRARPVAYFCSEFGLHESLPTYSGGLGVLAGDHLKAASDLAIPMVAVGLFYAKGYFEQSLDRNGWQQEHYLAPHMPSLPLEPVMGDGGRLRVSVQTNAHSIWIEAWLAWIGRNRLVLLDTNVAGNSDYDRSLTATLYGGDHRLRILQEAVLGIGGMRMLAAMGVHPGVIHLNEGHAAFASLELTRQLMERDGQTFENARRIASAMTVFTTHTPVEAGHDRFEPDLARQVLGPTRQQLGLSEVDMMALGRIDPEDRKEPFCMTVLGLRMSRYRNAVSALNARVCRAMWRRVWPDLTEDHIPISHITNGVHVSTWLAEPLGQLYSRYVGPDWQERIEDPHTWADIDKVPDADLWEIHQGLRHQLIEYSRRVLHRQAVNRGENEEACNQALNMLDPQALTIGFARRFASYKRAYLLLADWGWLDSLVNGPRPVQFILAGKAHPNDQAAKLVLQQVYKASRDPRFLGKIVFLENYNINVARHLVQGVDLWLNMPRRPLEACGTSGQKVAINGGLNCSTLDGWWAEAFDGTNGFGIGHGGEHANWEHQDDLDAQALRRVMDHEVLPAFYDRSDDGLPHRWIAMQKRSIRTLMWRFSANRMLIDYALGCYLPAAGGLTSSLPLDTQAHAVSLGPTVAGWARQSAG